MVAKSKTMRKVAAKSKPRSRQNEPVAEQYQDEIEESFEGSDEATLLSDEESSTDEPLYQDQGEETLEALDEDYQEVSSAQAGEADLEAEAPEYGQEGLPDRVAADQELELVEGFDESILEMGRDQLPGQSDEAHLLDAWYADFADADTTALIRQQPHLSETTAEVVIGTDDRIRITNTTAYPWRTICSLRITARDGSRWIGTGWLVGPRTVITAGHVVYMHSRGGWVRSIEVTPGRNAANRPFGFCNATNFHSVKGWTRKRKRSHDYGAIILPRDCRYGSQLGYFGYANLNFFSLFNLNVNLSGYPGDKPSGTQWWHARRIKWVTGRTLVYNIDTAGGQSGSPVWRLKNGKRHVVGIHTNGASSGNSATRITKPVFNNIKHWKALGA